MAQEITFTTKVIAKLLDLTVARVGQLAKEGIIPKADNGRYPPEAIREYVKYLRDRAFGKGISPSDQHTERTRLLKAQADKVELEVAELEGSLIPADEVEHVWMDKVMTIRSRLLALPSRLAPAAISARTIREVEDFARTEIFRILNELAKETMPDGDDDGFSVKASDKTDSKRVGAAI